VAILGRLIVEKEQKGKGRAAYGEYPLKNLATKTTLSIKCLLSYAKSLK